MRRPMLISAAVGPVVAVLAFLIAPDPHRPGSAGTGDAARADRVRATLAGDTHGYRGLSVALVDRGQVATALVGEPPGSPLFEIGSTTKALTGMLFADLVVADGVVRAGESLASALPSVRFGDPDTASITLEELASHRSGLPRIAPGYRSPARSGVATIRGGNPYAGQDVDALLASAANASPGESRGPRDLLQLRDGSARPGARLAGPLADRGHDRPARLGGGDPPAARAHPDRPRQDVVAFEPGSAAVSVLVIAALAG